MNYPQNMMLSTDYRFGFNGQEKDNEIAGIGNHNTALFWEYDTRLGRRWNLDPVDQISISNYAAFKNSPILYNDVLGDVGELVVNENGGLTIKSKIMFYGTKATAALAKVAADNIQAQWTSAHGTVTYNGKTYENVTYEVTYDVISESTAKLMAEANTGGNYDPQLNFARIESRVGDNTNRWTGESGQGDNSFYFLMEDILAGNTSQSHEFGHGLGLTTHDKSFEQLVGQPGIMTTVQTLVEGAYTVDGLPSEKKVSEGGKDLVPNHPLDKDKRKVLPTDVARMKFSNSGSRNGNKARVGASTNKLFNQAGKVIDATGTNVIK